MKTTASDVSVMLVTDVGAVVCCLLPRTALRRGERADLKPIAFILVFSYRIAKPRSEISEADYWYVETDIALEEAAQQLAKADVIGVDIEHNHLRSYRGIVCLVQLHAGSTSAKGSAMLSLH